jgi:acyl-CoA synthetase (NDP forming)
VTDRAHGAERLAGVPQSVARSNRVDTLDARIGPFWNAASIVVVGASGDSRKFAGRPLHFLRRYGYSGAVAAVNPQYTEIEGFACYPSIRDLPQRPELALVMLNAELAVDAVSDCGQMGIRHVIVAASGFADAGRYDLQRALVGAARQGGINLLGPNCLGTFSTVNHLTAGYAARLYKGMFAEGSVTLLSQSGSMGQSVLISLEHRGVGIRRWAAVGNESDVRVLEFANWALRDPETSVIAMFVESVPDPNGWGELADGVRETNKPVVIYKVGRTQAGSAAAVSHSGKRTGRYEAWRQTVEASGIRTVDSLDELVNAVYALSTCTSRPRGRLASIGSGGLCVITADAVDRSAPLALATLTNQSTDHLRRILPSTATFSNPVDTTGVADDIWYEAAQTLVEDPNVDVVLLHLSSLIRRYEDAPGRLRSVNDGARAKGKALAITYYSEGDRLPEDVELELGKNNILVFPDTTRAVRALAQLVSTHRQPRIVPGPGSARRRGSQAEAAAAVQAWQATLPLLNQYLIPTATPVFATNRTGAVSACSKFGVAVMKLEDPARPHKSEAGLVIRDIRTRRAATEAYEALIATASSAHARVLVQSQFHGVEVSVGCVRDPEVGPILILAAGGIFTELFGRRTIRRCPLSVRDAHAMITQSAVAPLLAGYRGIPRANSAALADTISRISRLFSDRSELMELELNPIIVTPTEAVAVDVLATTGVDPHSTPSPNLTQSLNLPKKRSD